jgi:hypothetical protein
MKQRSYLALALLLLSACDSQAATEYRGEPLFTLQGSIDLNDTAPTEPLVPALHFQPALLDDWAIIDVDYTGDFPAQFTINIHEPPPPERMQPIYGSEGPLGARAFLVLAPRDHLATVAYPWRSGPLGGDSCLPSEACEIVWQWCRSSDDCRVETYHCDSHQSWLAAGVGDFRGCTLTHAEGDPTLSVNLWSQVWGVVGGYTLVYLEREAMVSVTASPLGDHELRSAGYSLLKTTPRAETEDERITREACEEDAAVLAADRYNALHDTAFTAYQLTYACHEEPQPGCTHAAQQEFSSLNDDAVWELECPTLIYETRRVLDPESTVLQLALDPNAPY